MDACPGSGRELSDPPAYEATTCPVCGRQTRIEPKDSEGGLTFTIEDHQQVVS